MAINKLQVEFRKGGYASVMPGVINGLTDMKKKQNFLLSHLSENVCMYVFFKFIWYMTSTKYRLSSKRKVMH